MVEDVHLAVGASGPREHLVFVPFELHEGGIVQEGTAKCHVRVVGRNTGEVTGHNVVGENVGEGVRIGRDVGFLQGDRYSL